jgi:HEAT repeat protein
VYQAGGQPPPKSEPASLNEILQAGRQAAIDTERAGQALLRPLDNPKLSKNERRACALALGKLRYVPAIPKLIELVDFEVDRDIGPQGGQVALTQLPDTWPCKEALRDYGELALPSLAEAYLKTDDKERQEHLASAFCNEEQFEKSNKTYAQGLLIDLQDYRSSVRLFHLLKKLQEHDNYRAGSPP